jgi:hypothetical protein
MIGIEPPDEATEVDRARPPYRQTRPVRPHEATIRLESIADPMLQAAIDRMMESARAASTRKTWRCGIAKLLVFCERAGRDPMSVTMATVDTEYRAWLLSTLKGRYVGSMLSYARRLVRAIDDGGVEGS